MGNGGYDLQGVIWHQHSSRLLIKIMEYFPKDVPVIDIGCGHNFYVSVLKYAGYSAVGCDLVDLGSKYFFVTDVTKTIQIGQALLNCKDYKKDALIPYEKMNVLSLEVGEHLPSELSSSYLDNLTKFGGDVIMSWAVEGQAGIGHINCRNNDWVIEQMGKRGYNIDLGKSNSLRDAVADCPCNWFRNTLSFFKKI
jgi:hypothetical protein